MVLPSAHPARRILIVRLGAVGDVIRALPLAHALKQHDPGAFIGWAVEEPSAGLLKEIACLDAVHVLPRRGLVRALRRPSQLPGALRDTRSFVTSLRRARYDLVLDVHGTFKAAWVATWAQSRVVGFGPGGSKELAHRFHDVSHPFPAVPMSRVERALFLGACEGLLGDDPPHGPDAPADFGLAFPAARVERARALLATDRRRPVILFPFASAKGRAKRWPIENHAALGAALAAQGRRVIMAWGSPAEGDEARAALTAAPGVELAPPTDLVELTELLRGSSVLVTGDTGPMHLAAAVGTPAVALFGPSDPVINHPWGRPGRHGHRVIVKQPLASLTVEEVLPAVLERS